MFIFTNLISTSIHGTRKKQKKNLARNKRKKCLESPPRGKRKKKLGSKRKKRPTLSDPLKKIKGYAVIGQKKTKKKTRESCNATITKMLNTRQWSQL